MTSQYAVYSLATGCRLIENKLSVVFRIDFRAFFLVPFITGPLQYFCTLSRTPGYLKADACIWNACKETSLASARASVYRIRELTLLPINPV